MKNLRVLVVDDTSLYRVMLTAILSEIQDVEVVGSAANGRMALAKVAQLKPDLITLDVEMPEMDGIEALRQLRKDAPEVGVIMVSARTQKGAEVTVQALELGAFDFVAKPTGKDLKTNKEILRAHLGQIVRAFLTRHAVRSLMRGKAVVSPGALKTDMRGLCPKRNGRPVEIVAIGISTGGPNALGRLLPQLPEDLRVPLVIVQHMPSTFTRALADTLARKSRIQVVEGQDGQPLESGTAYIAPGGRQMKIAREEQSAPCIKLTDDPAENHCRPSADYLFRSVAAAYGSRALGIIMTGMGSDGTLGLKRMKEQEARVIAQDEESCVVFGMPMEAIKAGVVDAVLPLDHIAAELTRIVNHAAVA